MGTGGWKSFEDKKVKKMEDLVELVDKKQSVVVVVIVVGAAVVEEIVVVVAVFVALIGAAVGTYSLFHFVCFYFFIFSFLSGGRIFSISPLKILCFSPLPPALCLASFFPLHSSFCLLWFVYFYLPPFYFLLF